ncbi:EpsG family protein [Sphingobacterium lactis]|uniref:EpsG family protein n=1 Tax=Sphingobacterium lactis TaxID=797291 RepID=UPI003EC8E71F
MKMVVKKFRLETFILLIISPILALPSIIYQIIKKDKWGGYFLSFILGLIGFLYIPSFSNDKSRYYERYELLHDYSFDEFKDYLIQLKKPDFVFDFIIFLFAKLQIPFEFFFLILTTVCVFLILKIVNKLISANHIRTQYSYLAVVFFVVLSFSLPSLYSGARFTLGATIFAYGILQVLLFKKVKVGILIILLSTQIHFSLLYLTPALILLNAKVINDFPLRIFFLISLTFFLLPTGFLTQILGSLNLSESLSSKTSLYTEGDDFVSQNFDTNEGSYLMFLIRGVWYYAMIVLLLFFSKRLTFDRTSEITIKLLYLLIALTNLTYAFPTIFTRYILVVKLIFAVFLIYVHLFNRSAFTKQVFFLMYILFIGSFLVDVYVLRYNFSASLFQSDLMFLFNILTKKIEINDFIR